MQGHTVQQPIVSSYQDKIVKHPPNPQYRQGLPTSANVPQAKSYYLTPKGKVD